MGPLKLEALCRWPDHDANWRHHRLQSGQMLWAAPENLPGVLLRIWAAECIDRINHDGARFRRYRSCVCGGLGVHVHVLVLHFRSSWIRYDVLLQKHRTEGGGRGEGCRAYE